MSAPLPSLLTSLSASIGTCNSVNNGTSIRMVCLCRDKQDATVTVTCRIRGTKNLATSSAFSARQLMKNLLAAVSAPIHARSRR